MVEDLEGTGSEQTKGSRGKSPARNEGSPGKRNWSRKTLLREIIKFAKQAGVTGEDLVATLLERLKDSILEDEVGNTEL
jgi:hypothetical protein